MTDWLDLADPLEPIGAGHRMRVRCRWFDVRGVSAFQSTGGNP